MDHVSVSNRKRSRPPPASDRDLKRSLIVGIVQAIVREVIDLIVRGRYWDLF
jgi:hypothetical protein